MVKKYTDSMYKNIGGNFYHNQTISKNPLRKWFHLNRYRIANSLVSAKYEKGKKIVDLGCGSCDWNADQLDVFGIDLNENLLRTAKDRNRLSNYKIADASNTGLSGESFDIAIAFEFLEHVSNYEDIIEESNRLLKKGGYLIISVPFDVLFGLWRPLFFLQVILQGYILGDPYYRERCGHINHFSPRMIKDCLIRHGYTIDLAFDMRKFTIFVCARKKVLAEKSLKSYEDATIILPTLNEAKNIPSVLEFLISQFKDSSIIVADDGSRDNTKEMVLKSNYKKLFFLDRTKKEPHGLTASVLDAIQLVKTKYFVVIDADGQHPEERIEDIVNILRLGSKLVIASRVEVEEAWGFVRKIISYTGTALGKSFLLLRGKSCLSYDVLSGFFGCELNFWNKSMPERLKRKRFRLKGYKILFDFLKYAPSRLQIGEIYYKFRTRKSSVSKINPQIYFEFLKSCLLP